ncbi:MAG: HlyD family type I secretion periplasmic adaptor subunit [Hydrogenophilales bacterium CG03_land_8_20_14_0_80_62_28]|nr:HlyD family type I secretion periplasmic adaptor subunit [Betaproteobacteria bacterium]OIO76825.1 MAG: secretion protein HylD [Hydrogenophilaceae bacterium CG1_02_62_390]PIV23803.1 MAG: HlyD family type I secretion periplasmic adaptor subunit [Hydrogenophilales bacterium CG03_land_8_20_14_0_80_62_28]PIW39314.1 MAG: HlyD family type I secretion periplasmic adaptor subunit [Hydrogenophilales bacterium CG15_BIG_FIL_POST_REV_8_21_14_020_62_31]PIX01678.1 MAG: HlyD family type I secretion periplas
MNEQKKPERLFPDAIPLPGWMAKLRGRLDHLLSRWIPHESKEELDWVSDADWAILQQEPLKARFMLRWVGGILALLLIWAAFAQIDEVTRGIGRVTPSRQLQVIQAVDPGVVSEIAVKEGQTVEQGQVLLKIDETRFLSSLQENQSQYLALLAKASRLRAISEGRPFMLPPEVEKGAPQVAIQERGLYLSKRSELDAQISIARQQLAQRSQELNEVKARREQAAQAYDLTNKELSVTKPLVSAGAVSEVELLRLQRDVSRYMGDRNEASAQITRIQSAILEAQHKIREVELNFRNVASAELADTMAKINGLSAGSAALSDRVKHSSIKSPVKGTVKRLLVNTVGGVVQPGTEMVEVVPSEDALLLEVRILPKDVAFLRPGLKAMVRFTAYDFSIYGGLEGVVDHVGADTVADERDKEKTYYVVQVHTLKSSLGKNLPLLPGMVAEVDIQTGKKSVLSYLMKPILRAHLHAMTER